MALTTDNKRILGWALRDMLDINTELDTRLSGSSISEGTLITCIADADVKEITDVDAIADASVKEITDLSAVADIEAVAEITTVSAVADVSDSLDGTFFLLQDTDGSVAFWIDTDDSGTSIPAGASAADRAIEITTIATDDTAATIGGLLRTAIGADSKFSTGGAGADAIVTNADLEDLTDAADGDTGFGFVTDTQGVTVDSLDGTFFLLQDEIGSVAFWFDVDDSGTSEPGGAAAADRSIEITTITAGDSATTVGSAVFTAITADSKFEAGVDNVDGTIEVRSSTFGVKTDGADGDTGFTIGENTAGVDSVLDGTFFILQDEAGSVAFWMDVDDSGTTIPAGASAADRAIEITTVNSAMTNIQVGGVVFTAIVADSEFEAGVDNGDGTMEIQSATTGILPTATAGDSGFTLAENTAGAGLNKTYFILQDEVGSVAFWLDVDNTGATEPTASAAADRSIEITTVTNAMTAIQVAGVVFTAIVADSKFVAGADNGDGTLLVQSSTTGDKTDGADGDTGFTFLELSAGDLTTLAKFHLENGMCDKTAFDELITALEAGSKSTVLTTRTKEVMKVMFCDNTAFLDFLAQMG